jgi:hypothetical protein
VVCAVSASPGQWSGFNGKGQQRRWYWLVVFMFTSVQSIEAEPLK